MEKCITIRLGYQENVGEFFDNFNLNQVVILHAPNKFKFIVNSVILSLHSPILKAVILKGEKEIGLHQSLLADCSEQLVRECLKFLHGGLLQINTENAKFVAMFAAIYQIADLWNGSLPFICNSYDILFALWGVLENEGSAVYKEDISGLIDKLSGSNTLYVDNRSWVSYSLNQIIRCVQTHLKANDIVRNHETLDVLLTWIDLNDITGNVQHFSKFLSSFDPSLTSQEFMADIKEVLAVRFKVNEKFMSGDVRFNEDTFYVSCMIKVYELKRMINNDSMVRLKLPPEKCQVEKCPLSNHIMRLNLPVKQSPDSPRVPLTQSQVFHNQHLVHYYLLALDDDYFVDKMVSLKVLAKSELLGLIKNYKHFSLKAVFRKTAVQSLSGS